MKESMNLSLNSINKMFNWPITMLIMGLIVSQKMEMET